MRAECRLAASSYRLALPANPLAGRAGDRLGKGTGSSLEFMDFRDYVPGDDLRHVDWRAYARTDQLKVRLFREEISPDLEILADLSPSMGIRPLKEQALRDLVEALAFWTRAAGGRPRRLAAGGDSFPDGDTVSLDGESGELLPRQPLKPMSIRFLVSDFLFPGDPAPMIRRLAAGAAQLFIIHLLASEEVDPPALGPVTLIDCEGGERLDLVLEGATIKRYQERLTRLREAVSQAVVGVGGVYTALTAAAPDRMFRHDLLASGIVEPS